MAKGGYIYILSNKTRTTLYVGVTSNLYSRIYEHRNGFGSTFPMKYSCHYLMYYEFYPTIEDAIHREKRLKKYSRKAKDQLISIFNPNWNDLFNQIEDLQ